MRLRGWSGSNHREILANFWLEVGSAELRGAATVGADTSPEVQRNWVRANRQPMHKIFCMDVWGWFSGFGGATDGSRKLDV